ncbi:MAG: hypothetical protein F6K28_01860 [Microcoleus sp. SIO2G3]|nr:hypothetical protein [Microcoleus sp. SIO2G3]
MTRVHLHETLSDQKITSLTFLGDIKDMQRLFKAVAGAIIMGVGSGVAAPAHAELLDFSFTTVSGATGSFTLDTDTPASPEPSLGGGAAFPGTPGTLYPNAVSDLFLSSTQLNLSGVSADYEVVPGLTSAGLGLPPGLGVLSGPVYPAGCSVGNFTCAVTIGVLYSGNPSELSDDPASYLSLGIEYFDPATGEQLNLIPDLYTNFQVVRRQPVPESDSTLSVLAVAITSASLLLKRKMNKRVQPS